MDDQQPLLPSTDSILLNSSNPVSSVWVRVVGFFRCVSGKINLRPLLAPSTIAATIGFAVGSIAPIRRLLVGTNAPLHVVGDSVYMLGDAAIPALALIIGANLLKGLNGSGIKLRMVLGIVAVRYIVLPLTGIMIVTSAVNAGLVPSHDRLLVFILLLQYSLPPAMNLGTMTQLFGAGQSECSVIMLWTYGLASVAVTLWCTVFLWLVA